MDSALKVLPLEELLVLLHDGGENINEKCAEVFSEFMADLNTSGLTEVRHSPCFARR